MTKELLTSEIKRKAVNMTFANLSVAGAGHIDQHVSQTEEQLKNRIKAEHLYKNSAYSNEKVLEECLYTSFTEEYSLKRIANWLLNSKETVLELDGEFEDEKVVGTMILKGNDKVFDCTGWNISIERLADIDDRNPITGMPFDIKTTFPTSWEAEEEEE